MKIKTIALLVGLSVSTSAFAGNNKANSWEKTAHDAWIDGKAETTLLLNTNLNSFDINTDVKDGKVYLTGKVESDVDKALAEELIEGLDGVKSVENNLTVLNNNKDKKSDFVQSLTDSKVTTVVKTRLLLDSNVSGTGIDVSSNKGIVILKGEVNSSAERDLAVTIAENTNDVKRVIDKINVIE
ncbi:BON domain-containing protein [Flocculibacter collagenilyticus]|uniref:BON domain-containing protein n=1 Tax=Flocculibacter collagenilyticus TaxID=2744479 RepID=UPI0018F39072|nr:BON domain-containing protein [Flocculibacter collagenilyticus]